MGVLRRGGQRRDFHECRYKSDAADRQILGTVESDDFPCPGGDRRAWRSEMLQAQFLYGGERGSGIRERESGDRDGAAGEDLVRIFIGESAVPEEALSVPSLEIFGDSEFPLDKGTQIR